MYEVKVEGMSCGHCVMKVTKSLQGLDSAATSMSIFRIS